MRFTLGRWIDGRAVIGQRRHESIAMSFQRFKFQKNLVVFQRLQFGFPFEIVDLRLDEQTRSISRSPE